MKNAPLKRKTPLKNKRSKLKKTALKKALPAKKRKHNKKRTKVRNRKSSPLWNEIIKCDQAFSQYIRLSHADKHGEVKCYTCTFIGFWKQSGIECGHFKGRSHMSTRWLVSNCKPQCIRCNQYLQGNLEKFEANLIKEYGNDYIPWINAECRKTTKLSIASIKKRRIWLEKEVERLKSNLNGN